MIHANAQRSAGTGWVLAIVRAMRSAGVDPDQVMSDIGMDPTLLEGGFSRYSQDQVSQLWRRAINLTKDPNFVPAEYRLRAEIWKPLQFPSLQPLAVVPNQSLLSASVETGCDRVRPFGTRRQVECGDSELELSGVPMLVRFSYPSGRSRGLHKGF